MTLDEILDLVSSLAEQAVGPDDELFDSGILDSLALVDLITELDYDFELFDRTTWGTCRKISGVLMQWISSL